VTYERVAANEPGKIVEAVGLVDTDITYNTTHTPVALSPLYGMQRCHWYRIVRKSAIEEETAATKAPVDAAVAHRRMTVTVGSELQSLTIMRNDGNPVHVNAALVMPSVVNVFPRSFNTR
jgi:hypothetical protein